MKKMFFAVLFVAGTVSAQSKIEKGQSLFCKTESIKVNFSEDVVQGVSQDLEVYFSEEMLYLSRLDFANERLVVKVSDCPDEDQCWSSKASFLLKDIVDNKVSVRIENSLNGVNHKPRIAKCSILKK